MTEETKLTLSQEISALFDLDWNCSFCSFVEWASFAHSKKLQRM